MADFGSGQAIADDTEGKSEEKLTPELVRQVTDKVYQLLLKELQTENERRRSSNHSYR